MKTGFSKSTSLLCALDVVLEMERNEKYLRLAMALSAVGEHEKAKEVLSTLFNEEVPDGESKTGLVA